MDRVCVVDGFVPGERFRPVSYATWRRWFGIAAVSVLLISGLLWVRNLGGPVSPHEVLSATGVSLRERFNEAHGYPRAVLVASPT